MEITFSQTIPIKTVIASYFSENPEKTEIDFKKLREFKYGLENKFRENGYWVYVHYDRDDLINLEHNHSNSFEVNSEKIKLINNKDKDYFLACLPCHMNKEDYKRFFSEVNSTIN